MASTTPLTPSTQPNALSDSPTLADILKDTPIEPLTDDSRENNYLRWLAFYYLSKRELSQQQLRQKLLNKGCDAKAAEALLQEFADKGYQSDERCALMLIREAVRLGRGKRHIEQKFWQQGIDLPYTLDELIDMAGENITDGTILEEEDADINWLKLAVEARSKKYGNALPQTPKEKARQLRFLQYRGFSMDICFEALKLTLADFDDD